MIITLLLNFIEFKYIKLKKLKDEKSDNSISVFYK